jgi:hypothetical protein
MKAKFVIDYEYKQNAYNPDVIGFDVESEKDAAMADANFLEDGWALDRLSEFLEWLESHGIWYDYSFEVTA